MALNRQEIESYLSAFKDYQKNGAGSGPAWLKELRESAIESFEKLGFPTSHDEDWKYTSVGPLVATAFQREERNASNAQSAAADAIRVLPFASSARHRLVFVNGIYFPELSGLAGLPPGVRVESLANALRQDDDVLPDHLSRYVRYQQHSFVALNTAFIEDGALVLIPRNTALEEPICLVFVSACADRPVVSYPRNLVIAGEGSQARIVESYVGAASGTYLANAVTEISGGEGASIEHYLVQRGGDDGFHVGTLEAQLSRQCNLSTYSISLAGSWVRNDVHVILNGEGSECSLNGLYLVDGKQHVDNHTEIEHCKPRARSQELYKGILGGSARGVFNGRITVHQDAQKSDARQTNKNLVLSENAVIHTKPQLEIRADDVKCSHGSTVGQLDRDALFYLQSRGIGSDEAQSLLCYAFASEVVSRVKIAPLRSGLDDYLLTKFRDH